MRRTKGKSTPLNETDRRRLAPSSDITRPATRELYELSELVSRITADNSYEETKWGKPTGREHW